MSDENIGVTAITVVVNLNGTYAAAGSPVHKFVADYFASESFLQLGANREIDEQLLQDVSCELTTLARNGNGIWSSDSLNENVNILCANAKGYSLKETPNSNMVIFTVDITDVVESA